MQASFSFRNFAPMFSFAHQHIKISPILYKATIILYLAALFQFISASNDESHLQLGSLNQAPQLEASIGGTQKPDLRTTLVATLNSRRTAQNHHSDKLNATVSASPTRGSNHRRRLDKDLTTDCRSKRIEILGRQKANPSSYGATASHVSSTTTNLNFHGSNTSQRLRPNRESSPANDTLLTTNHNNGEHVPRCNSQGGYEPIQCHDEIRYCWCVNKYGRAIKNSAKNNGERPDCDPSLYEIDSNDLVVVAGISKQKMDNILKPKGISSLESTTPNGNINFEADSTTESVGDNLDGHQQVGDDSSSRRAEPTLPLIPNNCSVSRVTALERATKHVNDSIWVPDCDLEDDRLYALRQCHKSKVCWCVDQISGLPLKTKEPITSLSFANCTEIQRNIELTSSRPKSQPAFYHSSSENCVSDKRIEFVASLASQFRQQISDYMAQNPASSLPQGLISIDPFSIDESQVSRWKFILMDKDLDGKLGDREWSNFKNNFKLVDHLDEFSKDQQKITRSSFYSLTPLMIVRSQRKCWREFLEFCGNGYLLNDESVGLSKWLSCTEVPSKTINDEKMKSAFSANTYAHSQEAAIIRSKKKNPFLGILKPD